MLGTSKEITNATAKIVEACPEGKEWKLESNVKKLKWTLLSISSMFGLARPNRCFISWANIPEHKTEENKSKL